MPGGGGSRHQAIRQEPHRAHAPSRPRSLAQRRLPLGARGRAARPEKPSEIRGPSRPRPRSWPRTPIGRRSPHRRGLRHARGQDHLRSKPCQPKSPKPKTFWGKLVLQVEEEVKPFWQSKPKRRWRDATPMDLAAPEIGRKSRPASQLSPHKEPEPATDLSAPADSAKMVHHKSWLALTAVAVIGLAAPAGARP